MQLTEIYKKGKTGTVVYCNIKTIENLIVVETGQFGTYKPVIHKTVCEPKNIGKANETSSFIQAELEAKSKHAKKMKAGYVLDQSGESNIKLPMKVKIIQDQWNNVVYPCISTPKLNGVNGTYRREVSQLNLYSRGGDIRPRIPHIEQDIIDIMGMTGSEEVNVELYVHGEHLQDISSSVTKTNELSIRLEAAVFDIPGIKENYEKRREIMGNTEEAVNFKNASFLLGIVCYTRKDIEKHYEECVARGMEGTVIKNLTGKYVHGQRSSDQFKYKKALDAEYRVISYDLDKQGHAVWVCLCNITHSNYLTGVGGKTGVEQKKFIKLHTFSVKRKGMAPERLAEAAVADTKLGSWLKIEYETLSKDKKPLKPVGVVWRDCDKYGKPLE